MNNTAQIQALRGCHRRRDRPWIFVKAGYPWDTVYTRGASFFRFLKQATPYVGGVLLPRLEPGVAALREFRVEPLSGESEARDV